MQADSRKTGIQAFIWTEGDNERLVQRLSHQQRSSMAEWTVCLAKSTAQENKATFSSQSGVSDRDKEEEWERDMVGEEDYSLIKNVFLNYLAPKQIHFYWYAGAQVAQIENTCLSLLHCLA